MSFGAPEWLWALLAIPVLIALFVRAEHRSAIKLREFVAPRLLAELGATVSKPRRRFRFALLLVAIALALVSLARPRWGYTYEDVKRKGLDLIIAVDTSRSMLANDVLPNRLERVKLAAQDLITELRGDRVGLIAFAGRAFLQAPLTIDYDAAVAALTDLDTKIIPEGGTNISEAINLAVKTYGKSAIGNRALIIFTDGEDLAGDAVKVAKAASDAGVRIFTVGVGTPEGSFIPLTQAGGGTSFVKDSSGQVVKSKLDEKRLREIAETTGGIFVPLENGPASMQQLYREGIGKMQAGEIDARTARRPIERYQWPLAAALLALATSVLINERKSARRRSIARSKPNARTAVAVVALSLLCANLTFAASPGLDEYNDGHFNDAYNQFQETLKDHPKTDAADKIQFDSGAAAYRMKDYGKALQSFSQALLSPDAQLQSRSHYNLGNTLYQRGEAQKTPNEKLKDWTNALQHYEQTLKIEPENKEAKENYEFVKNKIEELKKQQPTPTPTPTPKPSPSPSPKPQDKKDQKDQKKNDQQQSQDKNKDKDKEKDKDKQQQQDQSGQGDQKDQNQKDKQQDQQKPGQTPTPSPTPSQGQQDKQQGSSPTPSPNESSQGSTPSPSPGQQPSASPSPGENQGSPSPTPGEGEASPTPSPGEGENEGNGNESPSPGPSASASPSKKPTGDLKSAAEDQSQEKAEDVAAEEQGDENQMSAQQAERLLRSMRDEEKRVQLDEHKAVRRVYKDW
ncbi:MAG: VWA domain-containing protein [Verrucomicrobiota bacterium]|nr:VWA domain-containing protein [Verrucomicrobiota bacterium]